MVLVVTDLSFLNIVLCLAVRCALFLSRHFMHQFSLMFVSVD